MHTKPTLIFLPGSLCNAALFSPQIEALNKQYHCIVANFNDDDTINGMALRVLDTAPQTFSLVGLSMGGIVAFEIMRLQGARVNKLALIDTNPYTDQESNKKIREQQIAQSQGQPDEWVKDLILQNAYPRYVADHNQDNAQLRKIVGNMALEAGVSTLENQWLALGSRRDATQVLQAIDIDVCVIYGEQDQLCPPSAHTYMADHLKHCSLHKIVDAGHLSTLEQPEAVNTILTAYFSE